MGSITDCFDYHMFSLIVISSHGGTIKTRASEQKFDPDHDSS